MGNVRFITDKEIDEAASFVLTSYARKYNLPINPPVPVEDILDLLYDIPIVVEDFSRDFADSQSVLAALWYTGKEDGWIVRINSDLDPEKHPERIGRYRFSVAHEIGHWVLHQDYLMECQNSNSSLLGG